MIYFIWINKNANLLSILISNEIAFLLDVFKSREGSPPYLHSYQYSKSYFQYSLPLRL